MMCGLIVGINCANAILQKEAPQYLLVFGLTAAMGEAGARSAPRTTKGRTTASASSRSSTVSGIPLAKVDVAVRVESDSHFHIPLSTTSWLANASSTGFSGLHVPAISLRLRRRDRRAVKPDPAVRASTAASFRLLPDAQARSRSASSKARGCPE